MSEKPQPTVEQAVRQRKTVLWLCLLSSVAMFSIPELARLTGVLEQASWIAPACWTIAIALVAAGLFFAVLALLTSIRAAKKP